MCVGSVIVQTSALWRTSWARARPISAFLSKKLAPKKDKTPSDRFLHFLTSLSFFLQRQITSISFVSYMSPPCSRHHVIMNSLWSIFFAQLCDRTNKLAEKAEKPVRKSRTPARHTETPCYQMPHLDPVYKEVG